jgi:hypothetical protein
MAVAQIAPQPIEDEHQIGHAEQGIGADLSATGVPEDPGIGAEAEGRAMWDRGGSTGKSSV